MGALTDRFGPGRMILAGLLLAGAGFIAFSHIGGPGSYYATWLIVSVGISIGGFTPSIAAVNSWMAHRRATAMAVVLAGSSAGGLLVPLLAWAITAHGWRTAVVGAGVSVMISGPLMAWVVWRRPPGMGQARRGPARAASAADEYDFTPREALRTRAFWAISGAHTLANFSVAVVQSQVVLHLQAVGLTLTKAALVVPVMGAVAFAFQLIGGFMGDRFDKRYPAAVFLVIHAASVAMLAFTASFGMAMAFAVVWGIGFGGRTPILHAMRGDFFGRRHYATIMSLSAVPMALGMTLAPVIAGRVFDVQGTYRWVFVGLAAACAMGAWVVLLAVRPKPPQGAAAC
jgi:MFS family permease